MKNICFLSCQSPVDFVIDDQLAMVELEKNGEYKVVSLPWDNEVDWSQFDLVVIRSTWDYFKRPDAFIQRLKLISSQTKLLNSYEVVQWNVHKGYLKELESKGVSIVPTEMFKYPGKVSVPADWKYEQFIIKPAISANAFKTIIVAREDLNKDSTLSQLHAGDWLLQPYLAEIKQGEVSLHYFHKQFSHGILKVPKSGDFRVQEEHGGSILTFDPSDELLKSVHDILQKIPFDLLYARVDLVNWNGLYVLMELELIEPALYLRTSPVAPKNFKAALDKIFTTP